MTILNTIYKSEIETLKTKTEVVVNNEQALCTRLINGKIYTIEVNAGLQDEGQQNGVKMSEIAKLTTLDDDIWQIMGY